MEYNKYFGIFNTSGDVQTALDNGNLNNPYVALVGDGLNYNTEEPIPNYAAMPLTFEVTSDGNISIKQSPIEYRKNDGEWTAINTVGDGSQVSTISVVSGDTVQFRKSDELSTYYQYTFSGTSCGFNAYGNIMSLYYPTSFANVIELQDLDYPEIFLGLFDRCTGLTDASNLKLPATTLVTGCYEQMFEFCTSLTSAPELPATALTIECYNAMFLLCSSLTTAPELLAPTLTELCYASMFVGCTSLNYIKCLATDISALSCTSMWVGSVAETGTFVKAAGMSDWTIGSEDYDGIPANWTVEGI